MTSQCCRFCCSFLGMAAASSMTGFHHGVNLLARFSNIARHTLFLRSQPVRFRRAFVRKPLSVILPQQDDHHENRFRDADDVGNQPMPNNNIAPPTCRVAPKISAVNEPKNPHQVVPSTNASCGVPSYEKLGENDAKFTFLISLTKSKKMRDEQGKILLEGRRLIKDAIEAGVHLDSIYFSKEENLLGLPLSKISNLKLYKVFYKQMSLWSDLTTSPGVMGVFNRPKASQMKLQVGEFPVTVICDNIREPGNLGAILRCVTAAGCKRILLSKGCTDVWEPKVLRGGAGAHFHIQIENNIPWELMRNYCPRDAAVYLASNEVVAGNGDPFVPVSEDAAWYEVSADGEKIDHSYTDTQRLVSYKNVKLQVILYHQIPAVKGKEAVVVVGGETEGLSAAAYKFAYDCNGCKVTIPLVNNVESLNVAVATGIILFQIKALVTVNAFPNK